MDPDVAALVRVTEKLIIKVDDLVHKVDGLLCHFSAIDADYVKIRDVVQDHAARISRLEKEHNFTPDPSSDDKGSALFPAIKKG
jgi:hypothetical protein